MYTYWQQLMNFQFCENLVRAPSHKINMVYCYYGRYCESQVIDRISHEEICSAKLFNMRNPPLLF